MRYAMAVARFLLGTRFVIFGLNTFLWAAFDKAFMQPPAGLPQAAAVLYHHYLDSHGLAIAYVLLALELFLA